MTASVADRVERELAALAELDRTALLERWRMAAPPRLSRTLMEKAIAYDVQVKAFGRLSARTRRALRVAAKADGRSSLSKLPSRGTRLIREWHGTVHEVEVLEDGYLWRGARHRSLSAIARAITGPSGQAHASSASWLSHEQDAGPLRHLSRKSSDEGLEQVFNSLDAQREACAAYVASQRGEGWRLLPPAMMTAAGQAAPSSAQACNFAIRYRSGQGRSRGGLQGRSPDTFARRFCQAGGAVRQDGRLVRLGDPAVQHRHQHGSADVECPALLRSVRARGHG